MPAPQQRSGCVPGPRVLAGGPVHHVAPRASLGGFAAGVSASAAARLTQPPPLCFSGLAPRCRALRSAAPASPPAAAVMSQARGAHWNPLWFWFCFGFVVPKTYLAPFRGVPFPALPCGDRAKRGVEPPAILKTIARAFPCATDDLSHGTASLVSTRLRTTLTTALLTGAFLTCSAASMHGASRPPAPLAVASARREHSHYPGRRGCFPSPGRPIGPCESHRVACCASGPYAPSACLKTSQHSALLWASAACAPRCR